MKFNKNFISKLINIKIEHQTIFKKYLENSELWEHFFPYLLLNKIKWIELNETLCIFQKDFLDKSWQLQSLPLGESDKIIKALKYLTDKKIISKILFTTERDLNFIRNANIRFKKSVKITEEFIYRTEDLIELQGDNYKKIRQHINWFKRNYPYESILIKEENFKEINEFLEIWYKEKIKKFKEVPLSLKEDFKNTSNVLKYLKEIEGVKSLLIKSNNRAIGISISGLLNKKMAIHFIMKTLYKEYKGITEFSVNEVAKNFSETLFLNSGGYGKSESLRTHKIRLHPVKINSLYKVYF